MAGDFGTYSSKFCCISGGVYGSHLWYTFHTLCAWREDALVQK